jgi:hypothetical protein
MLLRIVIIATLILAASANAQEQETGTVRRLTLGYQISHHATPGDGDGTTEPGVALEVAFSTPSLTHCVGFEYQSGDLEKLTAYTDFTFDGGASVTGRGYGYTSAGLGIGSSWDDYRDGALTTILRASAGYALRTGKRMELTPALIYRMVLRDPFGVGEVDHSIGFQFRISWAYLAGS